MTVHFNPFLSVASYFDGPTLKIKMEIKVAQLLGAFFSKWDVFDQIK